ncbi:hypothetical protein [Polynucleobacter sp. P1-05-14]|uniref:hypothetical protein n=1 Tax=Polynucleobacter sp. P1-05-14 TaxID=1819732 RepID=UPI001C0AD260|nr:hypothetical protein [Polynucleobacter sp. P1-05-14]MBU3548636.1 hypothetical protein [Polynucleobacter sp. P1-05-14]
MIVGLLLGAWLAIIHPQPVMAQAAIDCARIIGLPRLKTMDKHLNRVVVIDEMHTVPAYAVKTRKEFFTEYFKITKLTQ